MSLLIISERDPKAWVKSLRNAMPDIDLEIYPKVSDPSKVTFALVWNHPHGIFKNFPNLRVIASMGAGIDHIIADPSIPSHIKITRIIDQQLTKDMSVFVLALLLDYLRNLSYYYTSNTWEQRPYLRPEEVRVGIMGMGVLGVGTAERLIQNKFDVIGWSRSKKEILGVKTFFGEEQLQDFLQRSDVLICLLPLTSETENILNRHHLECLPKGAYLINVARGRHLVEQDLLEVIDSGHLSGASLDVFREEPLPKDHPFWRHKKIRVSPHIASVTLPESVVPQILDNYRNMQEGKTLQNEIAREKEY